MMVKQTDSQNLQEIFVSNMSGANSREKNLWASHEAAPKILKRRQEDPKASYDQPQGWQPANQTAVPPQHDYCLKVILAIPGAHLYLFRGSNQFYKVKTVEQDLIGADKLHTEQERLNKKNSGSYTFERL